MAKVAATEIEGRRVFSVRAFNEGVATWLQRLPTVWVEGEVTELRRQARWQSVFFTLKDPENGACLAAQMPRGQFDALRLDLVDGERVHVYGRPELFEQRGDFRLRVLSIERYGLGAHLAALERLKQKLAREGLFAAERKRPLPRIPRLVGLVTGNDAAAKRDVLTAITTRFPPANVVVAETYVQGPRAPIAIVTAISDLCARGVDVLVLARGGGSFEDLLPFSDERLVRAVADCPVPVVSAVGHEQDTPLCDLAADMRASTPSVAARLVVPDFAELRTWLERAHAGLGRGARRTVEKHAQRVGAVHDRLRRAPVLALERKRARLENAHGRLRALSPQATLDRGYAIVRAGDELVRTPPRSGTEIDVKVAAGSFGARVE
ncbi:MAG TPA: exodeoxyribonuclease VII large subunit [Gaiellaceae bacterium]|jgi:exodeoxyribonuclease VII large subunit